MKRVRKMLSVCVIIVLLLSLTSCQRLEGSSHDVIANKGNIQDPTHNPEKTDRTQQKDPKDDYLIPFAQSSGFSLLYGYEDKQGNIVIEPKFSSAQPFYECGIAIIGNEDGKEGLINKQGTILAKPDYAYISYSDGLFLGYNHDYSSTTAFNEKGEKVFEIGGYLSDFSNGLAVSRLEGKRGYIDKTGKLAIALEYESLGNFRNSIAVVSEKFLGPCWYIDTNGNDLTDKLSNGLSVYKDESSQLFGYMNQKGEVVIETQYSYAEPFLNGFAIIESADKFSEKYGVIDTDGNQILKPVYCGIRKMSNGLFVVGEEVKPETYVFYGYFEHSKKAVFTTDLKKYTDWIYYSADDFDDENICVNDENSILFLNRELTSGSMPEFKGRGLLKKDGDLLRGYYNSYLSVADKKGNILTRLDKVSLGDGILATNEMKSPERESVLNYPVLSGMKDKSLQDNINRLIKQEMDGPYESLRGNNSPDAVTTISSGYIITRQKNLLSIDQNIYAYTLGGAHGGHFRNTIYLDMETTFFYELNDLFKPGTDVYSDMSKAVSAVMKKDMEKVGYWEDHVDVTPKTCFVLGEEGITLYFAEYEIASYAMGLPEFFIPFTDLTQYIDTQGEFWKSFH